MLARRVLSLAQRSMKGPHAGASSSVPPKLTLNLDPATNVVSAPAEAGGDVAVPEVNLGDFIWGRGARDWPDRVAFEDAVTGRGYTFREGEKESRKLAKALRDLGLKKGDVVALFLPNCPEYPVLAAAIALSGSVATTVNPAYKPGEIAKQLELSRPKAVFTRSELVPVMEKALERLKKPLEGPFTVVSVDAAAGHTGAALSYRALLDETDGDFVGSGDFDFANDLALLPFSSGTTGLPKGVMLTHRNLVSSALIGTSGVFDWKVPPTADFQASTVVVLPMFHIYAFNSVMVSGAAVGERHATLERFTPDGMADAIKKHKPTFLALAPPLLSFLAESPKVTAADLECVRYVSVAAAPVGAALKAKIRAKMPNLLIREGYGLSETSAVMCSPWGHAKADSCGMVFPNTRAKVVDVDTGEGLGPGRKGELCVQGPMVMRGYLGDEGATGRCLSPDGWFRTGDLAYFDGGGHFYIADRLKELIKVRGFQVPPAELEDLVRGHPAVADVAVVGVPDGRSGEVPRAYVVAKEGGAVTEKEIADFVAEEVAVYKRLAGGVELVPAIPKSAAGKILRRELRERYLAQTKQKGSPTK